MSNFILIAICILSGMLFRRSKFLPADAHKGINAWIIYLALPAVSFKYLPHIQWSEELLFPVLGPIIIWLCAWIYIRIYASASKLDKPAEGGLKLTAGLANTSFLGFPLVAAWFGEQYIGIAIICDQVTFMLLSTAGIIVAMNSSEHHELKPMVLVKKLLTFPPFIGCVLALTVPRFIDISSLDPLFNSMAGTVGPLALFSIGLQLQFAGWQQEIKHISFALVFKLFLAPLLVLSAALIMGLKGIIPQITIFEASMATLLSSGIIADQYRLRPKLANLVIGIGIVLSFITTAGWYYIITHLL
jgi:malate permease and related proteins